jgi:hypothetical protein
MNAADLIAAMTARADADGLSAWHVLRIRAQALADAVAAFSAEPPTITPTAYLHTESAARQAWADYTGEAS